MQTNRSILITGAAGFIGSALFELLKSKKYEVYGIDFDFIKQQSNLIDLDIA